VKNKHIGLRLGMAFAVLIAVLMGIGQLGLRRMHEVKDTVEEKVKQRTRDLNEANKHLNLQPAALEAAANAIVIPDVHGTIMWVNPAFTTMTGYSREEALSKNARLLKSGGSPKATMPNCGQPSHQATSGRARS
jgi:PAS domain-containing protein